MNSKTNISKLYVRNKKYSKSKLELNSSNAKKNFRLRLYLSKLKARLQICQIKWEK